MHIIQAQTSEMQICKYTISQQSLRLLNRIGKDKKRVEKMHYECTSPNTSIETGSSDSKTSAWSILSSISNKNALLCSLKFPYPVFLLLRGRGGRDTALYCSITLRNAEECTI